MLSPPMSRPSNSSVPSSGVSNPQISLDRVDLPAPLRPTMASISPRRMVKLTSVSTRRSLVYPKPRPRASRSTGFSRWRRLRQPCLKPCTKPRRIRLIQTEAVHMSGLFLRRDRHARIAKRREIERLADPVIGQQACGEQLGPAACRPESPPRSSARCGPRCATAHPPGGAR